MKNNFDECVSMSYTEKYRYLKTLEKLTIKEIVNLNSNLTDVKYEIIKMEKVNV